MFFRLPALNTSRLVGRTQLPVRQLASTFASRVQIHAMTTKEEDVRLEEAEAEENEEVPLEFSKSVLQIDTSLYDRQLAQKTKETVKTFREKLTAMTVPDPEVFSSTPKNYRMRAEFQVWFDKETREKYYVMHQPIKPEDLPPQPPVDDKQKGKRKRKRIIPKTKRVRIDEFPAGSVLMNELMKVVMEHANKDQVVLGESLFQVNIYTTLSKQCMVTLLYHRKLDDAWTAAAKELRTALAQVPSLSGTGFIPHVIGRARKQRIDIDSNMVQEVLTVEGGKQFKYTQVEETFSQPNAYVCQHMLSWARKVTQGSEGGLVELYCGNGNFSIALAENFSHVFATELSAASVEAAKKNLELNNINNITLGVVPSEEFSSAWKERRQAKGMAEVDWAKMDLRTLFVDPPRAGLDPESVNLCRDFEKVVYISCNPATLLENLVALSDEFEIEKFALFDQFPYTSHLEAGVVIKKRTAKAQ